MDIEKAKTQYSILQHQVDWLGDKKLDDTLGIKIALNEIEQTITKFKEAVGIETIKK